MQPWKSFLDNFLAEGISTAQIDRDARSALDKHLSQFIEADYDHFAQAYPDADSGDIYDAYYQWKSEHRDQFLKMIAVSASEALTRVTQHHVRNNHGDELSINMYGEDKRFSTNAVAVFVTIRDFVEDEHKDYGGYFQGTTQTGPYIRVYVNASDVFAAALGVTAVHAFGEGEDADRLTYIIAPVFVHEYAHLEQFIRGGSRNRGEDYGYVTAHGGRTGGRRDPRGKSPRYQGVDPLIPWLRYKSSAKELDSFASEAASEIVASTSRYRSPYQAYGDLGRDTLSNILTDIALGYSSSPAVEQYHQLNYRNVEGEFVKLGVKPHEMKQVWQRFLKLVYKKLFAYRRRVLGKHEVFVGEEKTPDDWVKAAEKGMPYCVAYLAHLVSETDGARAYDLESKASVFIDRFFFGDLEWDKSMKILRAFSALVKKRRDEKDKLRWAA
jgi:hypothetical protein